MLGPSQTAEIQDAINATSGEHFTTVVPQLCFRFSHIENPNNAKFKCILKASWVAAPKHLYRQEFGKNFQPVVGKSMMNRFCVFTFSRFCCCAYGLTREFSGSRVFTVLKQIKHLKSVMKRLKYEFFDEIVIAQPVHETGLGVWNV